MHKSFDSECEYNQQRYHERRSLERQKRERGQPGEEQHCSPDANGALVLFRRAHCAGML